MCAYVGGGGGGEHSGGEPNPGPPVDDSVLCGPLQGLFLRRGIAGSGD